MKSVVNFALAGALFLTMGSIAQAEFMLATPNSSYTGVGFDDGGIKVFAGVEEAGGYVAVCGLVIVDTTNNTLKRGEPQITRQIVFKLNGKRLKVQSANFKRYKSEDAAFLGKSGCSVTKVAWQAGFEKATLDMGMSKPARYTDQY